MHILRSNDYESVCERCDELVIIYIYINVYTYIDICCNYMFI